MSWKYCMSKLRVFLQETAKRSDKILKKKPTLNDKRDESEKEAKKLLRESNGEWLEVGKRLYAIYKQDKKAALRLLEAINKINGHRGIKLKTEEEKRIFKKAFEELTTDVLIKRKMPQSLKKLEEDTSKAILGLATLSGIKAFNSDKDIVKAGLVPITKELLRQDEGGYRRIGAMLMYFLGMYKPCLPEALLAMFDEYNMKVYAADETAPTQLAKMKVSELAHAAWVNENGIKDKKGKKGLEFDAKRVYEGLNNREKKELLELAREAVRSDVWERREAAVKLIGKLGLQEEFKPELMLLVFDEAKAVREAADEAWKKAGLGSVKAEYKKMNEEEKKQVKELIREAAKGNDLRRREAAVKLIGELGLQEEFLDELIGLVTNKDETVHGIYVTIIAAEALAKWNEELKKEGSSLIVEMERRRKGWVKEVERRIRERIRSDNKYNRIAAVKLIDGLELQEELLDELLKLVLDRNTNVAIAAAEVLANLDKKLRKKGSSMLDELEKRDIGLSEEVKEKIRDALMSGDKQRQKAAVKFIGELGLQEEFLDELRSLARYRPEAAEALNSWIKDRKRRITEIKKGKAPLANPFASNKRRELTKNLLLAMVVLCS